MSKTLFILKCIILLSCSIFVLSKESGAQKSETKKTIAVLDFVVNAGMSPNSSPTLTNVFRSALITTQKYNVLERNDMESILKEQALALSGVCNSAECAVEIGQLLSAEKIVLGDIGKIGQVYSINLRLVDVSTGKIDQSLDEKFKGDVEELITLFKVMAQKLAGTYKEPTSVWWYIGGAAIVSVGVTTAILLSKSDKNEQEYTIGTPPGTPVVP